MLLKVNMRVQKTPLFYIGSLFRKIRTIRKLSIITGFYSVPNQEQKQNEQNTNMADHQMLSK